VGIEAQKDYVMTDGISKMGRGAVELNSAANKLQNDRTSSKAAADKFSTAGSGGDLYAQAAKAPANDEVILSKTVEAAMSAGGFDEAKVAEIKLALAEGKYPLDERRIAESFVAIETMLGGK
jgi:negative regulator of flagellin synthesis FlgM